MYYKGNIDIVNKNKLTKKKPSAGEQTLVFQKLSDNEQIAGNPREYRIRYKTSRFRQEIPTQGFSS